MKILSPTEDKIIVELSAVDLTELDITYEDMDYSTSETRRVMWTLLDRAGKALDRDINPAAKMMIEAMPNEAGGCTVSFTILEGGRSNPCSRRITKPEGCLTFEFCNADSLLDFAGALLPCRAESSLYEQGGKYRLLVSGVKDSRAVKHIVAEYAEPVEGSGAYEFTREHWNVIMESNALERFSSLN